MHSVHQWFVFHNITDLRANRQIGTVAAPDDGMKVYWLGLAGWLLILGLQLLLARAASAKRRMSAKSTGEK